MKKIDLHIEELLHYHDCVIIPDFGGFITTKKPAYYNQFTSVFSPASKRILFNKHLVYNDGLLATQIAEKRAMSVEEATQCLLEFKDDCFFRLNENGRVEIEKVGVLFFDKEKNIQFHQSNTNFLRESFGLGNIEAQKVKLAPVVEKIERKEVSLARINEVKTDRAPQKETRKKEVATKKKSSRINTWIPMLVFPLLLAGFYVSNEKGYLDNDNINVASFDPFSGTYVPEYQARTTDYIPVFNSENTTEVEAKTIEEPTVEINNVEVVKVADIPEKVDSTFRKVEVLNTQVELKYHVIIGCFNQKENADNLVEDWTGKGYSSNIIDKKGSLYRTAVESFATRKEAKSFLKEFKKSYKNSLWILKK